MVAFIWLKVSSALARVALLEPVSGSYRSGKVMKAFNLVFQSQIHIYRPEDTEDSANDMQGTVRPTISSIGCLCVPEN